MTHGIVSGMKLKIDQAGRIVVPKPLRERLGFRADTQLEAIEQPDGVLLKRINNGLRWLRSMVCGSIKGPPNRGKTGTAFLMTCAKSGLSLFSKCSQVDIFFDTTVLVAASVQSHPHYTQARSALLRITAGRTRDL